MPGVAWKPSADDLTRLAAVLAAHPRGVTAAVAFRLAGVSGATYPHQRTAALQAAGGRLEGTTSTARWFPVAAADGSSADPLIRRAVVLFDLTDWLAGAMPDDRDWLADRLCEAAAGLRRKHTTAARAGGKPGATT